MDRMTRYAFAQPRKVIAGREAFGLAASAQPVFGYSLHFRQELRNIYLNFWTYTNYLVNI
jgi:hypothetical protein